LVVQVTPEPGQLSEEPTSKFTTAVHAPGAVFEVMLPGQVVTVGFWWSSTVTVKLQALLELPTASVAVQLTVVAPLGKVAPLATGSPLVVQVTPEPGQLSEEPTLKFTTAVHAPGAVFEVMLPGQVVTVGFWWSSTVTEKLQGLLELPTASVAVQLTVVVPLGKLAPLVTGSPLVVQVTPEPGQLSEEPTSKFTTAAHAPGAVFEVMLPGQVVTVGF
jgi:CHASE1-domain containing sensor protein